MSTRSKTLLVTPLFFLMLLSPAFAEAQYPNALGVQVGRIAGFGISYQRWEEGFGYQLATGLNYHSWVAEGDDRFVYNLGFEIQRPLVSHDISSWLSGTLYLFAGIHHRGYEEALGSESTGYTVGPYTAEFGAGAGVGVEAILFDHFAFGTEFVIFGMYTPREERFAVNMLPQLSLRYRF